MAADLFRGSNSTGVYDCLQNDKQFGPAVRGCGDAFDFTLMFEQTILSIAPSALFLLVLPVKLYQLLRASVKTLPNRVLRGKAVLSATLIVSQLAVLVVTTSSAERTNASVPSAACSLIAAISVFVLSYVEHCRSVRPSSVLGIYLFASLLLDAVQVRTLFLRRSSPVAAVLLASVALKVALLLMEAQSKRSYLRFPYRSYPPEATSGIFNRSFFWWLNSLLRGGCRKLLTFEDLYDIDEGLLSERLGARMQMSWDSLQPAETYTLAFATASCLRWELIAVVIPRLCLIGFSYAQPFLISRVIVYVSGTGPETNDEKNAGYGLIAATGLIYVGIAISTVHYKHFMFRMITAFRGALVTIIYNRTLTLRSGVYDESTAITLMSTDIDRISNSLENMHETWARLIEVGLGTWLLAQQLGWVCVGPAVLAISCTIGNSLVAKTIGGKQKLYVEAVQRRVAMTASMLGSMKSVKMMGLGKKMSEVIQSQQLREIDLSKNFRIMIIWLNVFSNLPIFSSPVAAFIIFAIKAKVQGSPGLTTEAAFTSLALITLLTKPMSILLSCIPILTLAFSCFARIQKFLSSQSVEDKRISLGTPWTNTNPTGSSIGVLPEADGIQLQTMHSVSPELDRYAVFIEHASFSLSNSLPPAICNVTLGFKKATLTMVVGPVGCGKTVLMQGILGEIPSIDGRVYVSSTRMAYCAQSSWLLNTSIQRSVCGDSECSALDNDFYSSVMHACALDQDMLQLPHGDQSVIGSRGLTLSGGQKQRLALARAAYARRDIVLLDDILSALDATTEALIFQRLLGQNGLFKRTGSTVILVTHTTRYLSFADSVIVMNANGSIAEEGAPNDLRHKLDSINFGISGDSKRTNSRDKPSIIVQDKQLKNIFPKGPSDEDYQDLTRRTGDSTIYRYYFRSIGWKTALVFFSFSCTSAFSSYFPQIWLKWWTESNGSQTTKYILVYVVLSLCANTTYALQTRQILLRIVPKSALKLHSILLGTVMRAPLNFFSETDTGSTLNRFSQDMTLIDGELPIAMLVTTTNFTEAIAQAVLLSTGSSYMGISIPFYLGTLYVLQNVYLRTSRQLRFMDLEAKSPLYSHFLETLDGLSTIRAFSEQEKSRRVNTSSLDRSQRPYYLLYCIQRWLNLILDLQVAALAVIVVALAVQLRNTTSGGAIGVALNNLLGFNQTLSGLIQSWTGLETSLGAISRIRSFESTVVSEARDGEDKIPDEEWPSKGAVEIQGVAASYGQGVLALRDVSISIVSGQKIGICGRTGSGKSTLLLSILRLVDIEAGSITIDGVDLSTLPRELIRSRLITIPQDPFILSGTVRLNADPAGSVEDPSIINALNKVHLWEAVQARGGLDAQMSSQPLSQGQQQLFCLARALLQKSTILLLDEATSNVDLETDQIMQKVIREQFSRHTIITVAHRLDTILDSDKVAVMEGGRVVEFESPEELLNRPSAFKELYGH